MRDYAITTDSSCDFDQALADSLGVTVVPLSVQIGPRRFRNAPGEAMDSHSFYQLLSQGELAQTSAPNVEEFKAVWRPILQSGRDLLYLGFSSGLSGTYHNAAIAAEDLREEFPEARIITVDTLCASLGQGMLVDLTVQEKRQGKTLDEAAAFAEKNRLYLCHWFTVGDLSQLRRGGRLSAGKAIVGNLLNIKPVVSIVNGEVALIGKARGERGTVSDKLRRGAAHAVGKLVERIQKRGLLAPVLEYARLVLIQSVELRKILRVPWAYLAYRVVEEPAPHGRAVLYEVQVVRTEQHRVHRVGKLARCLLHAVYKYLFSLTGAQLYVYRLLPLMAVNVR